MSGRVRMSRAVWAAFTLAVVGVMIPFYQNLETVDNDRAVTMFTRLAGKPPTPSQLNLMLSKISSGDPVTASQVATSDPDFINITVRTFCAEMSTRALSSDALFNDFTATCMGIVRDNTPVTDFTTANYYYRIDPKKVPTNLGITPIDPDDPTRLAALYQTAFNFDGEDMRSNHYAVLTGVDFLFDVGASLVKRDQQYFGAQSTGDFNHGSVDSIYPNPEPAGLITTTAFLLDEAVAGTNRRMVQYAFHDFMCADPADYADNGLVSGGGDDTYVGQDVDRFPGGDHNVYETSCKACHGILDGMRGAFAYNDVLVESNHWPTYYNTTVNGKIRDVTDKYRRNNFVYPGGHATVDDSWTNLANVGLNAQNFGWRGPTSGKGAHSFGVMLAGSKGFSRCMVQRVFRSVCGRVPTFEEKTSLVPDEADVLEANQYNLRKTFERIAATPACIESLVAY
jgi:hypothetical protein